MYLKYLLWVAVIFICCYTLAGQEPGLHIDIPPGSKPWTGLDFNNDAEQFHFAIVSDRTGGHRPGVFIDGVKKLNLLQPEFVMSVGDMIEGYTEDVDELNRRWKEINGFIDSLTMPFFYLPGNNDFSNEIMADIYLKQFGKTYYHFVYKDVLFLCLNSEEHYVGNKKDHITDLQYEYIKSTLTANEDVKWTLVFLHRPLWRRNYPGRWKDVEKLLNKRKHTVYAGHVHRYAKFNHNNGKYFMLGTTGAGSPLRGPRLGEFDHVSWITMTKDGPIMANLALNGIWGENVSSEKTREYLSNIWRANCVQIEPLLVDREPFKEGTIKIRLTNDRDVPMKVKLKGFFSWDLSGSCEQPQVEVAPNSVKFVDFKLASKRTNTPTDQLRAMKLKAEVRYVDEGLPDLDAPFHFNIGPEKKHYIAPAKDPVNVDGRLVEWDSLPFTSKEKDSNDSSLSFGVSYDDSNIYIAAKVLDDDVQTDTAYNNWDFDFLAIALNAEPLLKSALYNGAGRYRNSFFFNQAAHAGSILSFFHEREMKKVDFKSICKITEEGYNIEASIPIDYIQQQQGENWKHFRLNVFIQDVDSDEQEQPRYYFQPDWRGEKNRIGAGLFFRVDDKGLGK